MPEVLGKAGVYFDPKDPKSIEIAVENLINDDKMRLQLAQKAKEFAQEYSWSSCSNQTWHYLIENIKNL
jgi:glycosyltransferase involved in cell wall biosynthesis